MPRKYCPLRGRQVATRTLASCGKSFTKLMDRALLVASKATNALHVAVCHQKFRFYLAK